MPEHRRPFDHPAEAQAFFLSKRVPPGETVLPVERYFQARQRMQAMRQHSTPAQALLPSRAELGTAAGAGSLAPRTTLAGRGTSGANTGRAADAASGWSNLGPGNIGGRTLALVIDPADAATIYAGTADGGIWKTSNAGQSWAPVGDMLPSLAIGSLVMDPQSSSILYAGTGEGSFNGDAARGAGVFQTVDAGNTWTQMPGTATPDFYYVNKLALSPASGRLYAATGTGVWRYNPAGGSWKQLLSPNTFLGCFDLALRVDGSGNDVLIAACGSFIQGGIFRNSQAQVASSPWELVFTNPAMGRTSLAIAPSNPDVVYAVVASNANGPHQGYNQGLLGVFRSTQGGAAGTWLPRVVNTSRDVLSTLLLNNPVYSALAACNFGPFNIYITQGWYDITIAVDPTNSDRIWVGGIDLFRSDDGGQSFGVASYWWTNPDPPYNHADQHALAFPPGYDGNTNQTLYIGNDGGVFVTQNSLADIGSGSLLVLCNDVFSKVVFQNLNNGFTATQFYDGAVFPDGATYFGGTQDNGTVGGTDSAGPNSWGTLIGGDGGFVAVNPANTKVLYGTNTGLSLQKSIDGGQTFNFAVGGISDFNFLFIAPFIMDPTDPNRLWTGGSFLWRTDNAAANWSRASRRITGSIHASISAIGSSPADANHVLIGTDEGVIQRSSSALSATGNTVWPFAKPRVGYVSWLAFDPTDPNVAYATYSTFGGTHVWRTADGGATWSGIDGSGAGSLPDLPVNTIAIDPAHATNLYVGTDMGVFVSTDSGQSWALELTGFPDSVTDALVMHADTSGNRALFAFTHGRGAWKVNLP
jgi:photosystem II stability/assembly factor-like uncharacterized protein